MGLTAIRPNSAVATDLHAAMAEAEACGVSRLADLTGLDVLGIHVFQAVRPWGRCLSVHQGKGLTPEAAKIGALMEAVEFDHAEAFVGEQHACPFEELNPAERAPTILDYASDRRLALDPSEPINWVGAHRLTNGRILWTPYDSVSLDYTRMGDIRLDRTSNGVGARFDHEGACLKALTELVERDADQAWRGSPAPTRSRALVEAASIRLDWFEDVHSRARAAGLLISIYHLPAVIALDVFACEIFEPGAGAAVRRRCVGVGCGFSPENALLAGVLEAAQSRLTAISGVRDDLPAPSTDQDDLFGLAFPPSVTSRLKRWDEITANRPVSLETSVENLAEALAKAGYPDLGFVDLSRPGRRACVVKAVVPGLGAYGRARRGPRRRLN